MIEYALRARLLEVAAVTALVGDGTGDESRVSVLHLPDQPVWPCITLAVISGAPEYAHSGPVSLAEVRVQIDCWSARSRTEDAYDQVRTLGEAVRGALSGYTGTIASETIQSCMLSQRRVTYDDATQTYRESQDWMVGYTEA